MTAYNVIRLWCDHRGKGDRRQCIERFEVVAPSFEQGRQIAAQRGWTVVAACGDDDEGDRCPGHGPDRKPEEGAPS